MLALYFVLLLLSPAIFVTSIGFPVFVVARFAILRWHGEGTRYASFQRVAPIAWGVLVALAYGFVASALAHPVRALAASEKLLALIVPLVLGDVVLGIALSPARAIAGRSVPTPPVGEPWWYRPSPGTSAPSEPMQRDPRGNGPPFS